MFQELQMLSMAISHLSCLAIEDENYKKAHKLADTQAGLERLFERGKYYETACKLDVATAEKDSDTLLDIMEEMKQNLIRYFQDEETYGFLAGNERWERIRKL